MVKRIIDLLYDPRAIVARENTAASRGQWDCRSRVPEFRRLALEGFRRQGPGRSHQGYVRPHGISAVVSRPEQAPLREATHLLCATMTRPLSCGTACVADLRREWGVGTVKYKQRQTRTVGANAG
jgi:hypothetical protein